MSCLFTDLKAELDKFVEAETRKFHDDRANETIQKLQTAGHDDIGNVAEKWAKAFQQVQYVRL